MMFTYKQPQPYLIQMPPKTNRRISTSGKSMFSLGTQASHQPYPQQPLHPQRQKEIGKLITQPEIPATPNAKPMKWGEPTWFLFHTLAEKVKEEEFPQFRMELLKTIYLICSALPCPECAKHASDYLNGINFNAIATKDDLKTLLYTFHNAVNARKKYAMFAREELSTKYAGANTLKIIQNFMVNFSPSQNKTFSLDVNKHYRQMVYGQLVIWFNENIHMFME